MRGVAIMALAWVSVMLSGCLGGAPGTPDDGGPGDADGVANWRPHDHEGVRIQPVALHERVQPGEARTWAFRVEHVGTENGAVAYDTACAFLVRLFGIEDRELSAAAPAPCEPGEMAMLSAEGPFDQEWTWDGRIWINGTGMVTPLKGSYTLRPVFMGNVEGDPARPVEAWAETTVYVEGREPQ